MQNTTSYANLRTFDLLLTAILIALVFAATLLLNIKLPISPNGSLVHFGTGILFIVSAVTWS